MARRIREENLLPILEAVRACPEGATASEVSAALEPPPPRRTLQYRLRSLVDAERLVMDGISPSQFAAWKERWHA